MNVSPALAADLKAAGHDAVHALDRDLGTARDETVMAAATRERRCLVTADLDFPQLLAASRAARPSVVLRLREPRPDKVRGRPARGAERLRLGAGRGRDHGDRRRGLARPQAAAARMTAVAQGLAR